MLMMKFANGEDADSECIKVANRMNMSICNFDRMFDGDPRVAKDAHKG